MSPQTAIDSLSVRRGLQGTALSACVATAALYLTETDLIIVLACLVGAASSLIPIVVRARKETLRDVRMVMALSRHSTRSYLLWLGMMVVYLIAGRPLGLLVFEFITGWCVAGLFFARVAFPVITLLCWGFQSSVAPPNKETMDTDST